MGCADASSQSAILLSWLQLLQMRGLPSMMHSLMRFGTRPPLASMYPARAMRYRRMNVTGPILVPASCIFTISEVMLLCSSIILAGIVFDDRQVV